MLFKSTSDIGNYIEINDAVNFESLKSSIRTAEKQLLVPIIGLSFYIDLDTKYNSNDLNAEETLLVNVIQAALAPSTMLHYIPKSEVNITDGGIRRAETETHKTAYQYQVTNLRNAYQDETDRAVEYLYAYLELKKVEFPVWQTTEEFKRYRSLFIRTGGEFQEYFQSASPWRNYMAMRSIMHGIEQTIVKASLGNSFYAALKAKTESANGVISSEETELLKRLKYFIAFRTITESIGQLAVRIDSMGISVINSGSSNDRDAKKGTATDNNLSHLKQTTQHWSDIWLSNALEYLKETASPTIFQEFYTWQQSISITPTSTSDCTGGFYGMY